MRYTKEEIRELKRLGKEKRFKRRLRNKIQKEVQKQERKLLGLKKIVIQKPKVKTKVIVKPKIQEKYAKYYHPLWIKRREQIKKRDNYTCVDCSSINDLQVHHLIYQTGFKIWEYGDQWLVTLCKECHIKAHRDKPIKEFFNNGRYFLKKFKLN